MIAHFEDVPLSSISDTRWREGETCVLLEQRSGKTTTSPPITPSRRASIRATLTERDLYHSCQKTTPMSDFAQTDEARLLSVAKQEAVSPTHDPAIAGLSHPELQALARRLREARDRARDIARQQRREMRGKAEPRGATATRNDTGTVA